MKFSQRIGKMPLKVEIQKESMDQDLRIGLWNAFQLYYLDKVNSYLISNTQFKLFFKLMWLEFFKLPIDNMDDIYRNTLQHIKKWFFECEWYNIYDFIEFVASVNSPANSQQFKAFCNTMLEREFSAYRFVDNYLIEITDENELKEIEEAIEKSRETKLTGVHEHLKTALSMLSNRKIQIIVILLKNRFQQLRPYVR